MLVATSLCTPTGARAQLDAASLGPAPTLEWSAKRPLQGHRDAESEDWLRLAAADCSAAAAEAAAETGGQVLSVTSRDDGGQTVCIVTLLVPGEDGDRPRKRTIAIPQ